MSDVASIPSVPSNLVDFSYEKLLANPKVLSDSTNLAQKYLKKYTTPEKAVKHIISSIANQCGAIGALTAYRTPQNSKVVSGLNAVDWYSAYGLELKMVLSIAILMGHNIDDEEVKAFVLKHFATTAISRMVRSGAIQLGTKSTIYLIDSIPGKSLGKLNRALGHRAITKRGKTGDFNLITYAYLGGIVVGATFDFTSAYSIGRAALREFKKADLPKATAKEIKDVSENSDVR